jgi:hypothetical protein
MPKKCRNCGHYRYMHMDEYNQKFVPCYEVQGCGCMKYESHELYNEAVI